MIKKFCQIKLLIWWSIFILSANFLTGCSLLPTLDSQEELKLGSVLPSTGELSISGQDMTQAVRLAIEEVNACSGINGQPVTLIEKDSKTNPAVAATAMTQLVEAGVAGVVGARASRVSDVMVDIAVRDRVMLISPSSSSPNFTSRAKNGDFKGYWARTVPSDFYQAQALAKLAHQQGINTLSTIAINNQYGIGFERQFVNAFTQLGGTVLGDINPVRYNSSDDDFNNKINTILKNKPEAVIAIVDGNKGSSLLQSLYQQGLNTKSRLFLNDIVFGKDFIRRVGKTAGGKSILTGVLGTVVGNNPNVFDQFAAKWQEKTRESVSTYFPHTWDATVLLMLSAQAANTNTGQGIQSKIREVANAPGIQVSDPCEALKLIRKDRDIDYQGVSGNVDIDLNGDVVSKYNVWKINNDGTLAIIEQVNPENP